MDTLLPSGRPRWSRLELLNALIREGWLRDDGASLLLVGVRGYYRDTMGKAGVNDRGIYDDAIFVSSPEAHVSFNANTDPSVYRPGIASLVRGRYKYALGIHNMSKAKSRQYRALVQAGPVFVSRDGTGVITEGWYGINIHRGSYNSTSSEGCQTIYPDQWRAFLSLVESEMDRHQQVTVPYILMESQG